MLSIDELKYNWSKPFLDLIRDMKYKTNPNDPFKILWYKEDKWYFEYEEDNSVLWCHYSNVWDFIFKEYNNIHNYENVITITYFFKKYCNITVLATSQGFADDKFVKKLYKI